VEEVEVERETDEETELWPVPTEALVLGVADEVGPVLELELEEEEETALQERSKKGVLLRGLPGAIPKLGLV
jgi:alcohol dehydrogenase YqhD (iron-dependent ADH family)